MTNYTEAVLHVQQGLNLNKIVQEKRWTYQIHGSQLDRTEQFYPFDGVSINAYWLLANWLSPSIIVEWFTSIDFDEYSNACLSVNDDYSNIHTVVIIDGKVTVSEASRV